MTKVLDKKIRLFRGVCIGWDYTFDMDIEIFVSCSNEIEDYSGCDYETAKKLITLNKLL
tara:strand:+ start:769 stop:945 length:177 start_codon:yes stop_codon:yes gene_type:complete